MVNSRAESLFFSLHDLQIHVLDLNFSTQISILDSHWPGPKDEAGKSNAVCFFQLNKAPSQTSLPLKRA